jgi:tetratricopeptide (TPR) repeat protein
MLYDALARWPEMQQVDPLRVQDAIARLGRPLTLQRAEEIARMLGAGRVVWGQVLELGDSTRVLGSLYRIGAFGSTTVSTHAITLAGFHALEAGGATRMSEVYRAFLRLARRLVTPSDPDDFGGDDALETANFKALLAFIAGDSALQRWDLAAARSNFSRAIAHDPGYPAAHLALAQLGQWNGDSVGAWRRHVLTALAGNGRLSARQRLLGQALQAMSDGRQPDACGIYRSLIARDSTDFTAWFGLGECLAGDGAVIPDARSPSGFAFRASYDEALQAYHRALTLLPSVHVAFAGTAISRLLERYLVETNRIRAGWSLDSARRQFSAFPMLMDDTLAFVPRPHAEVLGARWLGEQDVRANALARRQLVAATSGWVQAFPGSSAAWRAHAIALEAAGLLWGGVEPSASAMAAIAVARGLPSGTHEGLDLAIAQARLQVKLLRFGEARSLIDSLLRQTTPTDAEEFKWLAGLAAARGRVLDAANLLSRSAPLADFHTVDGVAVVPQAVLAADALRLLGFASFGSPLDSIRATAVRVRAGAAAQFTVSAGARAAEAALTDQAVVIGFPVLGAPGGSGHIRGIEQAILSGELVAASELAAAWRAARAHRRSGDQTLDVVLLEARLALLISDTTAARRVVHDGLQNLPLAGRDLLTEVPQAAAIGRLLALGTALDVCAAELCVAGLVALTGLPDGVVR